MNKNFIWCTIFVVFGSICFYVGINNFWIASGIYWTISGIILAIFRKGE